MAEANVVLHVLLDITLVSDGEHIGDTVYPKMRLDEAGTWQVSTLAGSCSKVELWGRHNSTHNWTKVAFDNSSPTNENEAVVLYPQMRGIVTSDGGGSSTSVYMTLAE